MVAVDGKVYAQIPLTPGWQDVDPAEYGAPDPAQLMSTDGRLLRRCCRHTTDLEKGESVRGGADNKEVLTEYTGTVAGDAIDERHPDRRPATSTRRTRSPTTASCAGRR